MQTKRIARHLSYANVMATIGVFIALGGASYAAVALPASSVGTKQLKKSAVAGSKIKRNAINSAKVEDGSLQRGDFASGTLLQGPQGVQGPNGDPGQNGAPGQRGEPGTARAYAVIDYDGGIGNGPRFVSAYVKSFVSVRRHSTGRYCVQAAAGIDPATMPAVVAPEYSYSAGVNLQAYWAHALCNQDEYTVVTEHSGVSTNDVAFTIAVL